MDFLLHLVGLCPDTNSHFDLINLYMIYIENNFSFKILFKYLEQKVNA